MSRAKKFAHALLTSYLSIGVNILYTLASVPLALIAVSGDHAEKDLYDMARYQARNVIQAVPGAMAPTVMGGTVRQATVYLEAEKLNRYNLSPVEVLDRLGELNTFLPAGDAKIGKLDYQILSNGMVDRVEDMNAFRFMHG